MADHEKTNKPEPKPEPKAEPAPAKALTADDVRAICREEFSKWKHDAAHTASQAACDAQYARDVEAGIAN